MSKYCIAGGIDCEHKMVDRLICKAIDRGIFFLDFESCPVESKQKPIVKQIVEPIVKQACDCIHKRVDGADFVVVYPRYECPVHGKYHKLSDTF